MKHYINPKTKEIFAFEEDGSQDHLITKKLKEITLEQRDELIQQKQTDTFNSLSYIEKRKLEYPPMEDYLDAVVKGDQALIQEYIEKCLAVKEKYTK